MLLSLTGHVQEYISLIKRHHKRHLIETFTYSLVHFSQTFTFCGCSESLLDLGEVEDHGQPVNLTAAGQVAGGHDRRDAQLLLQDAEGHLVVVNNI